MPDNEELTTTTDELGDEDLDDLLDDDEMTIGEFEVDSLDTENGNGALVLADDEMVDEEDDDVVDDDLFDDGELLPAAVATVGMAGAGASLEGRVAELEAAARTLAEAEVIREQRKVKRKVSAATTGAGAVGLLPVLLQLVGAIDLPPELAATASAAAGIIGAFVAGWATPERQPPLPDATAHAVLKLGED